MTSHGAALSGMAASTLYHYRVKSRDAAGNLAISGGATFTTLATSDTSSGLLAYWALDDGSGPTAADGSGNGADVPISAGDVMWRDGEEHSDSGEDTSEVTRHSVS